MQSFEMKQDVEGRPYFEVENDASAMRRRLHPQTGTEEDQDWPDAKPDEEAPPLIDLQNAWSELIAATPITVSADEKPVEGDSAEERNANTLVREIRYHVIASTSSTLGSASPASGSSCTTESGERDAAKASTGASVEPGDGTAAEGVAGEESDAEHPKSVYGASVLLKLQWNDRTVQKKVPTRTYAELGAFVAQVAADMRTALEKNAPAARVLVDAVALELTPLFLTRYLDGLETCTPALEHGSMELLKVCATHANPKEMHVAIKKFTSSIDSIYLEATSYLVLQPVLSLWGDVIARIPQKRRLFLNDIFKVFDRMLPCAEAFETSFVPEDGVGVEQSGRIAGVPDTLLDFFDKLVDAQIRQMKDGSASVEVDTLGVARAKPRDEYSDSAEGDSTSAKVKSQEMTDVEAITTDWILERAITLAKVLDMQTMVWSRLPPPPGEDKSVLKKKSKTRKQDKNAQTGRMTDEQKELSLDKCALLFDKLGWKNPAVVCHVAANGLNLDHASRDGELMKVHMDTKSLSKKQRVNTLYSSIAVGQYICGSLRMWTRSRKESTGEGNTQKGPYDRIDLCGTAFEFLEPLHALDLVMPYLAPVIMQANVAVSLAGIVTLRAFLDRIPDGCIESFDEILRLRSGTSSFGRDVNIFGIVHHVGKAIAGYDDPKHRGIAYETFQAMLRKCGDAGARYVLCEVVYYEANRNAVAAQLMTELKDVVRYADKCWREGEGDVEAIKQASALRSRLSEDTVGRYFIPRKELLGFVNPMCTVSSLAYFVIKSDAQLLKNGAADVEVRQETEKRLRFCREYSLLAKQLLRAMASVAEHDRKKIPESALAKRNMEDAVAIFKASGRTLNQCLASILQLDNALEDRKAGSA